MTDLNKAENNLPTKTLAELKVEIKFHLGQMAGHAVEIGNLLIQAKEQVGHGNFGKWLEDNFNLTQQSANRFMRVAERFGKLNIDVQFQSTQLITMLALPEGEEEKFIAAKAADGTPVEDMTVKNLRDEVAKWKTDYEQKKSEVENLFHDNESLKSENERLEKIRGSLNNAINDTRKTVDALTIEKNELEQQLKNQEPIVVEKIIEKFPDDYADTKSELSAAVAKAENLQIQLDKAMKNVEKLKKTNERLERKQYTLPEELPADACKLFQADIRDGLPQISDESVDFIITDPPYSREYIPLYGELSKVAARVLKDGGSLVCMVGQSYLPEIVEELSKSMSYHWCMCYLTFGASPQLWQKRTNTFWKPLLWFVKGKYTGDWNGNDVMQSPGNDKNFHKWGQSVGGMKDIVERFTNPNDVVLDPFLGGGTTGVTAVMSGRKFIGADIEQKCLDTTLERVKESYGSSARKNGLGRDEGISRRHRLWGVTCAATDIDFLLVEYNYNTPRAIVEYKNEHAPPQKLSASQYQVLRKLGDRAQIPVIAARYTSDFSRFNVVPVNQSANEFLPKRIELTESEFVALLYRIRDVNLVSSDVLDAINGTGIKNNPEQLILGF